MPAEINLIITKVYGMLKKSSVDEAVRLFAESLKKAYFDNLFCYE